MCRLITGGDTSPDWQPDACRASTAGFSIRKQGAANFSNMISMVNSQDEGRMSCTQRRHQVTPSSSSGNVLTGNVDMTCNKTRPCEMSGERQ